MLKSLRFPRRSDISAQLLPQWAEAELNHIPKKTCISTPDSRSGDALLLECAGNSRLCVELNGVTSFHQEEEDKLWNPGGDVGAEMTDDLKAAPRNREIIADVTRARVFHFVVFCGMFGCRWECTVLVHDGNILCFSLYSISPCSKFPKHFVDLIWAPLNLIPHSCENQRRSLTHLKSSRQGKCWIRDFLKLILIPIGFPKATVLPTVFNSFFFTSLTLMMEEKWCRWERWLKNECEKCKLVRYRWLRRGNSSAVVVISLWWGRHDE